MDARLLLLIFVFPVVDPSYLIYDLETECLNGSVKFDLSKWGAKSAAILRATSHTSFSLRMHCRARLEAPQGYAVMVSLREIGFRTNIDGSCKDYLQIQNRPICEKIFRKDEERHFDSLSNHPSNVMEILYHTGDGLDNKTLSGYPGFTFTFTAFTKGSKENISAFECTNANLIWPGLTCDGHNNCGDLSDEDPYGDANCGSGMTQGPEVLMILGILIVFVLIVMCVATLLCTRNEAISRIRRRTLSYIPKFKSST
ncbi:uncharacterized protein NPIL_379101 [Nephila pilipes]|uniref:CUB domain-containing protein n=1 Tax=Nephila pilipes TaxID=299642 RepID=A0A8X6T9N9_NEPPI|nr:uncharacterized protein NPIL_379101 [Nephila pilipes]